MKSGKDAEVQFEVADNEYLNSPLLAVAHELKNPLSLIRQLSLFLETQTKQESQALNYLYQISAVSERGLRLANDLIKAGRLNQLDLNLEPVSPTEICARVVKELETYFRLHDQRLVVKTKYRQHYLAIANFDLLHSILLNFCDNALHYASKEKPVEIRIIKHHRRDKIRIAVRDFGPRLPLDVWRGLKNRQKITPQPLSSRPLSSGIGIYLASQFAESMQAEVGAVSHSDGATLFVDLRVSHQLALL